MDYQKFRIILDKTIFEKSKPDLLRKVANYPERYTGLFRPTKPKAKIIQNLLQSHEIRFGDALESIIEKYLELNGFTILDKRLKGSDGYLEVDQIFSKDSTVYFIEQKVRDDHDSSKKRGQIDNFEKKLSIMLEQNAGAKVVGFFYFIDDSFTKNKNFYAPELERIHGDYDAEVYLCYGSALFDKLGIAEVWDEMLSYLKLWKESLPDIPEINFDRNPQASFEEIKHLEAMHYRKLFSSQDLDSLLRVLFPEQQTLHLLKEHFQRRHAHGDGAIYRRLENLCAATINRLRDRST